VGPSIFFFWLKILPKKKNTNLGMSKRRLSGDNPFYYEMGHGPSPQKRARARAALASYRKFTVPKKYQGYLRTGGFYGRYNRFDQRVMRGLGVEKKFLDTACNDPSLDTTWTQVATGSSIHVIPQGTTGSTRIGRKVTLTDINLHGHAGSGSTNDVETAPVPIQVKVAVVLDRQANGAVPAATDIWTTSTSVNSFLNLANKGRFKILYMWNETLHPTAGAGAGDAENDWAGELKIINWSKKVKIPIEFDSTTGAITEVKSNNITIWTCASSAVGSVTLTSRVRYTDM